MLQLVSDRRPVITRNLEECFTKLSIGKSFMFL